MRTSSYVVIPCCGERPPFRAHAATSDVFSAQTIQCYPTSASRVQLLVPRIDTSNTRVTIIVFVLCVESRVWCFFFFFFLIARRVRDAPHTFVCLVLFVYVCARSACHKYKSHFTKQSCFNEHLRRTPIIWFFSALTYLSRARVFSFAQHL